MWLPWCWQKYGVKRLMFAGTSIPKARRKLTDSCWFQDKIFSVWTCLPSFLLHNMSLGHGNFWPHTRIRHMLCFLHSLFDNILHALACLAIISKTNSGTRSPYWYSNISFFSIFLNKRNDLSCLRIQLGRALEIPSRCLWSSLHWFWWPWAHLRTTIKV